MLNSSSFNRITWIYYKCFNDFECVVIDGNKSNAQPQQSDVNHVDDLVKGLRRGKDGNLDSDIAPALHSPDYLLAINGRRWNSHVKQRAAVAAVAAAGLCGRRRPFTSLWLQAKIMSLSFYIINFNYPHKSSPRFRHRGWNLGERVEGGKKIL